MRSLIVIHNRQQLTNRYHVMMQVKFTAVKPHVEYVYYKMLGPDLKIGVC